jgi:hypothetical protein
MKRGRAESTVKNKRKGKTENTEEPPRCLVQMAGKKNRNKSWTSSDLTAPCKLNIWEKME